MVYNSGDWQIVEQIANLLEDRSIPENAFAFRSEAVSAADISTFVIATKHRDMTRIEHFQSGQKEDCFNRIRPSVNIIP
jgi:hypothetical protein